MKAFQLTEKMHSCGIAADCDLVCTRPESQMKYADKLGAKFSLVLGDSELEEQKAKVKNMATGEQKEISLGESFVDEFTQIYFDAQSSLSL